MPDLRLPPEHKAILNAVIQEHPTWDPLQIRAEFFWRIIQQSPGRIDDSHVLPPLMRAIRTVNNRESGNA